MLSEVALVKLKPDVSPSEVFAKLFLHCVFQGLPAAVNGSTHNPIFKVCE